MSKNNKSDIIYHYTSSDGILGIFDTNKIQFRFTKSDNLNDVTEGCDLLKLIERVCIELKNSNQINQMQFDEVIKFSDKEYIYRILNDTKDISASADKYDYSTNDVYVLCFSKNRDCLPMWNYYTNNSIPGYSIGFNSNILFDLFNNKNFMVYSVIYDDNKKIDILKKVITICLEDYNFKKLAWELYNYSYIFKHKAFEYEAEIRVIYYFNEKNSDLPKIYFRSKNGLITPYIQLSFEGNRIKDVIHNITIGPLGKDYIAKHNLCLYFENKGYNIDTNSITTSEIPIRF